MAERRIDPNARDRIGELNEQYRAFAHRVAWLIRIGIVIIFASAIGFTLSLAQNSDRINDLKKFEMRLCKERNKSNRDTVATLDRVIASLPGKQRVRAERSRQFTLALINTLEPQHNCKV